MNNPDDSATNKQSDDSSCSEESKGSQTGSAALDKIDHANARARLLVDGLSVFSFSSRYKRAEFAFVRAHHSLVKLKIYKNECELIWSTDNRSQFPYSTDNVTITINLEKREHMGRPHEIGMGDREDFRHLPNLAHWHRKSYLNYRTTAEAKRAISARLNVHDAIFYTYEISANKAYRKVKQSSPPPEEDLDRIGKIIGGNIFCLPNEVIKIAIKLPDGRIVLPDPLDNSGKYTITVRTKAESDMDSHFDHLYEILEKPANDPPFDLRFYPPESAWRYCGDTARLTSSEDNEDESNGHEHSKDESNAHEHPDPKPKESTKPESDPATEYACQIFTGGGGDQPDIP